MEFYQVMINGILFGAMLAVVLNVRKIRETQKEQNRILAVIEKSMTIVTGFAKHQDEMEENIVKALNQICEALNAYFNTSGHFMNHTTASLVNLLACMLPVMEDIKEGALEDEEYEKVQECLNIILNIQSLINPQKP